MIKQNNKTKNNANRRRKQKAKGKVSNKLVQTKYYNTKQLKVGDCTRDYVRALVNPFGYIENLPCIPDSLAFPSHKFMTKCRGVLSTGTVGTGYVYFNPFLMLCNDFGASALGNDFPVLFTNQLYSIAGLQWNNSNIPIIGVSGSASNSPFTYTGFFDNVERQVRLVGAGIRIKYVGSSFRNQGRICIFRRPGNTQMNPSPTITTTATLLNDNINEVFPVKRVSEYVHYVPDNPSFFAYNAASTFMPTQAGSESTHRSMGLLIDGADATTPQSWEFEAVAYFEAVGNGLTYSPSHSDVTGLGAVISSLPTTVPVGVPQAEENSLWQRFSAYFDNETTRYILGQATNVVSTGAPLVGQIAARSILNSATSAALGGRRRSNLLI